MAGGRLDIEEAAAVLGLTPEMIFANFCEIVFPKVSKTSFSPFTYASSCMIIYRSVKRFIGDQLTLECLFLTQDLFSPTMLEWLESPLGSSPELFWSEHHVEEVIEDAKYQDISLAKGAFEIGVAISEFKEKVGPLLKVSSKKRCNRLQEKI